MEKKSQRPQSRPPPPTRYVRPKGLSALLIFTELAASRYRQRCPISRASGSRFGEIARRMRCRPLLTAGNCRSLLVMLQVARRSGEGRHVSDTSVRWSSSVKTRCSICDDNDDNVVAVKNVPMTVGRDRPLCDFEST